MVSRILISIALLCSSVGFSQDENGLTFSQVLIVDITNEVIVPEGKVWKIVSVLHTGSTQYGSSLRSIDIDDMQVYVASLYEDVPYALPLWLPEGTSLIANTVYLHKINVIEFNTD